MPHPLIGPAELAERLAGDEPPTLLDVRWALGPGALRADYEAGHIPAAAFVDLDRDLSGTPGSRGRHPLPDSEDFAAAMAAAGVSSRRGVVVYDAANALAASRAWWLLRHAGHPDTRVLDGGLAAWIAHGGPLATGAPAPERLPAADFRWEGGAHGRMGVLDAASAAALADAGVLLDARAPERFRGDVEPLDRVGGHIPGARNRPMANDLAADGRFLDAAELRASLERDGVGEHTVIGAYCGSGITAAHTVLALEVAGFTGSLYPGSWSEWSADPARPVATGDDRSS